LIGEGASERSRGLRVRGLAVGSSRFLGPITSLPQIPGPSRGVSAPTAPLPAQGMREALSPHPPPSPLLQCRVPGRRAALAATTRQPALSPHPQWPAKTAGSIPAISLPLRRASPGRKGPGCAAAGILSPVLGAGRRGSAPSQGSRVFLLRSSRLLRAVRTPSPQFPSAVLQPVLPSGVAARHRTGTAVAPARPSRSVPAGHPPLPGALN
jgi:hypothetical protein